MCPPNVNRVAGGAGPVHSSMSVQETPVPEKPVLHAHVKAPSVSVHAALVSQLLDPSAMEGRGPSPLLSRTSLSVLLSIWVKQQYVEEVLGAGKLNTSGARAPRTASVPSPENYHSRYRMLKVPEIVSSLICQSVVQRQNVNRGSGGAEPVHSSMLSQETPLPEKPALHAHVKAPTVSVHAALVSQLWVPSALGGEARNNFCRAQACQFY